MFFLKSNAIGFKKFCGNESKNRMAGSHFETDARASFFILLNTKLPGIMVLMQTLKISRSHYKHSFSLQFHLLVFRYAVSSEIINTSKTMSASVHLNVVAYWTSPLSCISSSAQLLIEWYSIEYYPDGNKNFSKTFMMCYECLPYEWQYKCMHLFVYPKLKMDKHNRINRYYSVLRKKKKWFRYYFLYLTVYRLC